jgi:hypothetical protein
MGLNRPQLQRCMWGVVLLYQAGRRWDLQKMQCNETGQWIVYHPTFKALRKRGSRELVVKRVTVASVTGAPVNERRPQQRDQRKCKDHLLLAFCKTQCSP